MTRLNYKRTFLLGFGFFGVSIIWSVYNTLIPVFLRDYALPLWLVGFIMTLDNIAGIFIQPYVGQLSDHTRTRLGRRMPYILIGAPIAAIFFSLLPVIHLTLPHAGAPLILLVGTIIITVSAMAIFRTPVVALMPDITPSEQRSKANGIINLMGGVGTALAFLGVGVLLKINAGLPFWVTAVLLLAAEGVLLLTIREPREYTTATGQAKAPSFGQSFAGLIRTVIDLVRVQEKSALFICLAIFAWFMGYNAIETFWTIYCKESLFAAQIQSGLMTEADAVSRGAFFLTVLSVAFLLFAIPSGFIATRFGRKPTIMAGLGLLCVLWMGVFFFPVLPFIWVAIVLSGIAWALININSLPIVADLATDEKIGSYTGLYYLFSTLAASTSPTIAGFLMGRLGAGAMLLFAAAFMALALVCMLGVRRSEPRQMVTTVGQGVELAGDAEF